MTATTQLRIGDVAERVGTTPRTIRYYEEIGLLGAAEGRASGSHRVYTEADVERLELILRLKELLGVTLDDLKVMMEAEDARAHLRAEWHADEPDAQRRREILEESCQLVDRQLELVRARRDEIARLEADLVDRRTRNREILRELDK